MHKEMDYPQDDRTVLLDRRSDAPHRGPLTDLADAPRLEQLESRMVHAARLRPAEAFNISLNPLVSAAASLLSEIVRLKHSQQGRTSPSSTRRWPTAFASSSSTPCRKAWRTAM